MNKLVCILNNQSRLGQGVFQKLKEIAKGQDLEIRVHLTRDEDDGSRLVSQLAQDLGPDERLIIAGGDGSINQALNAIKAGGLSTPLGLIPAGTGNDFARSLKINQDLEAQLVQLARMDRPRSLDIIQVRRGQETFYAVNSIGFGLDGLAIELLTRWPRLMKSSLGGLAYLPAALSAFSQLESFPLTLEGGGDREDFKEVKLFLVSNTPYFGGGIEIFPQARPDDGILNVAVADSLTLADYGRLVSKLLTQKTHLEDPAVFSRDLVSGSFTVGPDIPGQMDGEVVSSQGETLHFSTIKHDFWL